VPSTACSHRTACGSRALRTALFEEEVSTRRVAEIEDLSRRRSIGSSGGGGTVSETTTVLHRDIDVKSRSDP